MDFSQTIAHGPTIFPVQTAFLLALIYLSRKNGLEPIAVGHRAEATATQTLVAPKFNRTRDILKTMSAYGMVGLMTFKLKSRFMMNGISKRMRKRKVSMMRCFSGFFRKIG